MKVSLDIHGVIDTKPRFFSRFSIRLKEEGNQVFIITGARITPELIEKLKGYGMVWDNLLSITDYHVNKKDVGVRFDEKGDPWMDKEVWNATKALICKENEIDLHIDDSDVYGKYFEKTVYLRIKNGENNGRKKKHSRYLNLKESL